MFVIIKTDCSKNIENINTSVQSVHEDKSDAFEKLHSYITENDKYCYKYHGDGLVKVLLKGYIYNTIHHYYEILDVINY